jgi:hypothetical protein
MNELYRKTYEYFQQQEFLPVNKESYSVFKGYEQYSSFQEMSATIITTWSFAYNGLYKIIRGYLCSVYFYEGKSIYFALHRPPEPKECSLQQIIDILYDLSRDAGLPFLQIKFIEDRFLPEFEAVSGYEITIEFHRDDCEYVYKNADVVDLPGTVNAPKRQRLKKCFEDQGLSLLPITNANIGLCLEIEKKWCNGRDCSVCASFSGCEMEAMKIMTAIFDERRYKGILLYNNDVPSGYAIGEIINKYLAYAYFGKALYNNHFLYIMYMMSKSVYNSAEYVNCNEDMGNAGLRLFKSHFGVYSLWNKYICTFSKKEQSAL